MILARELIKAQLQQTPKTGTYISLADFGAVLNPSASFSPTTAGLLIIGVIAEYTGTGTISGVTVDGVAAQLVQAVSDAGASSNSLALALFTHPITTSGSKIVAVTQSTTPQRIRIATFIATGLKQQQPFISSNFTRAPGISSTNVLRPSSYNGNSVGVVIGGSALGTDIVAPSGAFSSQINGGDTAASGDIATFTSLGFSSGGFSPTPTNSTERRTWVYGWWI